LFTLERFGVCLTGEIQTLHKYETAIRNVALESPLAEYVPTHHRSYHLAFSELYELVRDARNDALHQGAFARHLTNNATQLALIIEDALMSNLNTAADYMVREPVCASFWQPLSFIRQKMLVNSFTYLPVLSSGGSSDWSFISDYHIAEYLRKGNRKERLAKTLKNAVDDQLCLEQACTCYPDTPISEVLKKSKGKPVLVIDKVQPDRLLGIVTPFDLL
jgi:CBS domain-containing protein